VDAFSLFWTAESGKSATFAAVKQVSHPGTILDLYGDVSLGALTPPSGAWSASHDFYVDPGCSQLAPGLHGPDDYFSKIPARAVQLLSFDQKGSGNVLQEPVSKSLSVPVDAGDCIVDLVQATVTGGVDAEIQMTAVIQP
jgi:hypothetical protein